jgi:hypothetical protein
VAGLIDHATEIKRALNDPAALCERLGLTSGAKRQANGVMIRCPAHGDRTPSCSVSTASDGLVRVKCFNTGCGFAGDALHLVAVVFGLDTRREFKEVLIEAAELAGLHDVVDELREGKPRDTARPMPAPPKPKPPAEYPPAREVEALWRDAGPVTDDPECVRHLENRRTDPGAVAQHALARALVLRTGLYCPMPRWARKGGSWWPEEGYRMIVPVYDADGAMRAVRGWQVILKDPELPKRVPPAGHKHSGLSLANAPAVALLRGERRAPSRVLVVEGEPDFLTWATRKAWLPVFGVLSGSWHAGFAERIPLGSEVIVCTHHDQAGDGYAELVRATVKDRAVVTRSAA